MRKFRTMLKKGAALGAACAMAMTSLPLQSVVSAEPGDGSSAKAEEDGLVLWYDFDSLKSGTIINDMSGTGYSGVIRPTGSQVTTADVSIYGTDYTAYDFQGGMPSDTNTYVELPAGVFNGLEDMTVSCWVNMDYSGTSYQRIWDFGFQSDDGNFNTTSYMYLIADGNNEGHKGYTCAITDSGWGNEIGPQKGQALETGKWVFTTVTFDGSEKAISLYEDGVLIGTETAAADLSILEGANNALIGYGQFKNNILDGRIADFKIYDYAMTAEEVGEKFNIPDDQKVAKDKEWLELGDLSEVTENLTLPVTGAAGSSISWESSNEGVIATDGTVTRPEAGEGDAEVTLTATISSGDVSDTKVFVATVKQNLTAEEIVKLDSDALKLTGLAAVSENLALPTAGANGSAITWQSSNPQVIAADGTVTRPVGDPVDVTLTATVSYGSVSVEKEFTATVVPVYEKIDIVEVQNVEVETSVGTLPSLPGELRVTYENDTTGKVKVVWPTDLKVEDFSTAETDVQVKGTLVDYDVEVVATVHVTDKVSEAPAAATSEFNLSDISLDGTDTIFGQNMSRALGIWRSWILTECCTTSV